MNHSTNTDSSKNNDLYAQYYLFWNNGKPEIATDDDETAVAGEFRRLVKDDRFITSNVRPHGGYRQTMMAELQLLSDDSDQAKAGLDRYQKYNQILKNAGWNPVNWVDEGVEVRILATTRWDTKDQCLKYSGIAIFVENTEKGKALLDRIAKAPPKVPKQ